MYKQVIGKEFQEEQDRNGAQTPGQAWTCILAPSTLGSSSPSANCARSWRGPSAQREGRKDMVCSMQLSEKAQLPPQISRELWAVSVVSPEVRHSGTSGCLSLWNEFPFFCFCLFQARTPQAAGSCFAFAQNQRKGSDVRRKHFGQERYGSGSCGVRSPQKT